MKRANRAIAAFFSIAAMVLFITGCSTMRMVDSDVTAFPRWSAAPPGPGTTYRFERLPSQQALGAQQDAVEALARKALARVGMELNPANARYTVQVVINTQMVDRYPYGGYGFGMPGVFLGGGSRGVGFGMSFPLGGPAYSPYYRQDLTIQMRDIGTQQVVFESRALHDGPWGDTMALLPAMLEAALQGFPQPAPGPRRVNIEIPR